MSENRNKSRGLGRGLSSLMSDVVAASDPTPEQQADATPRRADRVVPIEKISPNPDQPRRSFSEPALEELAASIKAKGIIQPLIVRPGKGDGFEIVAGERRWRAAQRVGLHEIPVLVRELDDTEVLEFAIIENIQRSDLNAIDEAASYRQLMDRFGHTQEAISTALGKSRSHIANLLRLLTLPESVRDLVTEGKLSAGHARALVGKDDAEALARRIVKDGLSVREAEKLGKAPKPGKSPRKQLSEKDADTVQIENELSAQLKMGVQIDHAAGGESGKLILSYRNLAQLDDLLRVLSGG